MLDFNKGAGLVPVIIQDHQTLEVLMLGYMNEEAWEKTQSEKKVTFFSRSKNRLWTKGEESGNYLNVVSIAVDCDNDTVLIKASPQGPTCHTGSRSCFQTDYNQNFIFELEQIIDDRLALVDRSPVHDGVHVVWPVVVHRTEIAVRDGFVLGEPGPEFVDAVVRNDPDGHRACEKTGLPRLNRRTEAA